MSRTSKMASCQRHGSPPPKRTQDLLCAFPTDHATRMSNLIDFQRQQTFGLCTGNALGLCTLGQAGTPVLLTPFNGPTQLRKDGIGLRNQTGHRCYVCTSKQQLHKKSTDTRYHLSYQYGHMGWNQGERTSECRALIKEIAPDQRNCQGLFLPSGHGIHWCVLLDSSPCGHIDRN